MLEAVLQQLNNLATSYEQLARHKSKENSGNGEASSQAKGLSSHNLLFEGNGGIQGRTLGLDFPKFDGSEPMEWIMKAEQFFAYFHIPAKQKLDIALLQMEGKALSWFIWLKDSGDMEGWDNSSKLLGYDSDPLRMKIYRSIHEIRQTNTVEEYQIEFEISSNKIKGLAEEFRIFTFISGVKEELKFMVTMFKPNTLLAAFGLAKLQEEEVYRKA